MIRHVVLFAFAPTFPAADREAWTRGLDRMRGNIPGLIALSHGPNLVASERAFDYAIIADFHSLADIEVYNTHPLHEPLKALSLPNSESVHSVDFDLDASTLGGPDA